MTVIRKDYFGYSVDKCVEQFEVQYGQPPTLILARPDWPEAGEIEGIPVETCRGLADGCFRLIVEEEPVVVGAQT